jgi:NADPH-ferrihemoprotein reductase
MCDREKYNLENPEQLPEGSAATFAIYTCGEDQPIDSAVQLSQNLTGESFEFSMARMDSTE